MYDTLPKTIVFTAMMTALASSSDSAATADRIAQRDHLRIGLVTSNAVALNSSDASIARGVRLGAAEARQTARLFGDDVELYEATGTGTRDAVAAAVQLSSAHRIQVLIASSADDADALSAFAETRGILFLNVASRAVSLRSRCRRHTFHIEASDRTYANAVRLGRSRYQSRAAGASSGAGSDSVLLWSSALSRFGAAQINDRYKARYHLPMDGGAWAGWQAVKIASESALRARSTDASKLVAYLESPTAGFDGHKGWQLSFRNVDHQLRQPFYISVSSDVGGGSPGKVVDVPELHSASTTSGEARGDANAALDELLGPAARYCTWGSR